MATLRDNKDFSRCNAIETVIFYTLTTNNKNKTLFFLNLRNITVDCGNLWYINGLETTVVSFLYLTTAQLKCDRIVEEA